jgi:hypothetical protein
MSQIGKETSSTQGKDEVEEKKETETQTTSS